MDEERRGESADERKLHQAEVIDRIVDFSNGVMGFAITLLVTGIEIPRTSTEGALPAQLLELWPQFLAYLISFFVIGDNWIIYNRIFSHIVRYDERLYWLNLFFLFFIAVLPFPTSLVSAHPNRKLAVLLYAATIVFVSFARVLLWWYATRGHRLVHEDLDTRFVRQTLLLNVVALFGFVASGVVAFYSPLEAVSLWVILAGGGLLLRLWVYRKQR